MSYSLNSLTGGYMGDYMWNYFKRYYCKGDARSLDYSSYIGSIIGIHFPTLP